ncbi:DctP family TRAP transporter solute-binding subunit [Cloacibacillus porcorum]|uniref:DctP family TRAP transporter solute-binding subunit n=1 Tax=Cloacibacillus porcorum TaxID=1197717 RepID=UPI00145928D3|nr:DctP family TRAP transporter solute-binding subunit [Cloacibacillus porcorum]MCC8184176.1 DctP family TRAP transporter solute-binding subunit [Cloacibacillus porcorum]MDY5388980.1 DctP family TRAP transporter solute-binding subunit [Cloacibacillus porcorum]NMF17687.1 DctP family TRAP transporter solute-binding subunit [Cloacibacillus porcorum]
MKKLAILLIILSMWGILCAPLFANEKPVELRFAFELPLAHPWGKAAERFKELIESEPENNIKIKLYPAGQLGKSGEDIQQGVMMGTIDIGISSTPIVLINPIQEVFDLPFIFSGREKAWKILDGEIGNTVAKGLESKGLKVLAYWEDGFRQVTNSKHPIKKLEDFGGLKIRTPYSQQRLKTFEALGSKPTAMPFSEVFAALEQKVIDGQENPLSVIWDSSFYDVQKYLTITNHVYSPATLFISMRKWNRLSNKQREVILSAACIGRDLNRKLNQENDVNVINKLRSKGMDIQELTPEELTKIQNAVKIIWDEYKKKHGRVGDDIIQKIISAK